MLNIGITLAALAAFGLAGTAPDAAARGQRGAETMPIGVRYRPDPDPALRKTNLEAIRKLRFNVIAAEDPQPDTTALASIDRLLAGDMTGLTRLPSADVGIVTVSDKSAASHVRESAWWLMSRGMRAIVFDDWNALQRNPAALADAAAFAEAIGRNVALYAPLRRAERTGARALTIDGGMGSVDAEWLESADVYLLIAVSHAAEPRTVTFRFSREMPEAIWQNMLTGAAVNFIAGPEGPTYTRDFPPHDVLVLMITKRWR